MHTLKIAAGATIGTVAALVIAGYLATPQESAITLQLDTSVPPSGNRCEPTPCLSGVRAAAHEALVAKSI